MLGQDHAVSVVAATRIIWEMMMCRFKTISKFVFCGLFLLLKPVYAGDTVDKMEAMVVLASACQLRDPRDGPKVYLSNGAWRFRGTEKGTVHFYCPFPLKIVGEWTGNAVTYSYISSYHIWYHDPDGKERNYRVAARFYGRELGIIGLQLKTYGKTFNSNAYDGIYATSKWHKLITEYQQLTPEPIYHFGVTLTRKITQGLSPAFFGIDFTQHTWVPEG